MKISEWNLTAGAKKKRGPTESGSDGSMLEGGSQTPQGAVFVVVVLSLSPSTPSSNPPLYAFLSLTKKKPHSHKNYKFLIKK